MFCSSTQGRTKGALFCSHKDSSRIWRYICRTFKVQPYLLKDIDTTFFVQPVKLNVTLSSFFHLSLINLICCFDHLFICYLIQPYNHLLNICLSTYLFIQPASQLVNGTVIHLFIYLCCITAGLHMLLQWGYTNITISISKIQV